MNGKQFIAENTFDIITEVFLLFLVIFSPLFYAGTTAFSLFVIEITSLSVLCIFLIKKASQQTPVFSIVKLPYIPLLLFFLVVIFQLLPLPVWLVSVISPSTASLYAKFRTAATGWCTLSIHPEATVDMVLQFFSCISAFFVALNFFDTEEKQNRLISTVIICGFVYSLSGLICLSYGNNRMFFTFPNRDHFAAYVEMIIPLTVGYIITNKSAISQTVSVFMASVMILALFFSLSRTGMAVFSAGFVVFLFFLIMKLGFKRWMIIAVSFFLFLWFFTSTADLSSLSARIATFLDPKKVFAVRIGILKDTPMIIRDFPIFGTGLGTFMDIFQKYATFEMRTKIDYALNEPLQLIMESGILGFLFIGYFLVKYLRDILALWLTRRNPRAVYVTLGCFVGIVMITLHSFFDYVFHTPANMFLFYLILALIYRTSYLKNAQFKSVMPLLEISFSKIHKKFFIFFILTLLTCVGAIMIYRHKAYAYFEGVKEKKVYGVAADAVLEYSADLYKIDKAITLNPLNSVYHSKKADLLVEIALNEVIEDRLHNFKKFKNKEEAMSLALHLYKKAIDLNPADAYYHLKLGRLYRILGKEDFMWQEFNKAVELSPRNSEIKNYIDVSSGKADGQYRR